jgi:hypothetical protein
VEGDLIDACDFQSFPLESLRHCAAPAMSGPIEPVFRYASRHATFIAPQ